MRCEERTFYAGRLERMRFDRARGHADQWERWARHGEKYERWWLDARLRLCVHRQITRWRDDGDLAATRGFHRRRRRSVARLTLRLGRAAARRTDRTVHAAPVGDTRECRWREGHQQKHGEYDATHDNQPYAAA